jgi:hypothetical protein
VDRIEAAELRINVLNFSNFAQREYSFDGI